MISQRGIIIRMPASSISVIGRNTSGVRMMKIEPGDKVVAAAKVVLEEKATDSDDEGNSSDK